MEEYYNVVGNAHPDFLNPEFQMNHLDVIAHWLVNGVPYPEDVKKIDPKTWEALINEYPQILNYIDMGGLTKGIHGFKDGKFYVSREPSDRLPGIEDYTWYDDFEEALGKDKSKTL